MKKNLYLLDEDEFICGRISIESFDQQVIFDKEWGYRFFLTESKDRNAPCVDIFIDEDGIRRALFTLCSTDIGGHVIDFLVYMQEIDKVDVLADMWGDIMISGEDELPSSEVTTLYMHYQEDNSGVAFLSLICPNSITYQDLISDYQFIMNYFELAQLCFL